MFLKVKYDTYLVLLLIAGFSFSSTAEDISVGREKRTIDLVLRSVADAFGYDILKRPAVVLPPAPTTLAPKVSTFFPPPVAPLPFERRPVLPPKAPPPPPKAPPVGLPTAPPVAPPAVPPAPKASPPFANLPPQVPKAPRPLLPRIPLPLPLIPSGRAPVPPPLPPPPKAPAPPPRAPPKAPPPPPPPLPSSAPAAPPKPPAPQPAPVLRETVQKSFNLNFNWNKNVQPGTPAAAPVPTSLPPAPPGPGASGRPAPVPARPASAPAAPPSAPAARPPAPAAPPAAPAVAPVAPLPIPLPTPGGQHFLKKPQLYREYDYVNDGESKKNLADYDEDEENQNLREQFDRQSEEQQNNDYSELQNPNYSESLKNYAMKPNGNEQSHSKERFKESVEAFWQNFPLTEQHGYKYIAPPEKKQQQAHFSVDYPDKSKYEEYELVPQREKEELNNLQQQNSHPHGSSSEALQYRNRLQNAENTPEETADADYEEQAYIYLVPKDYVDYYSEEPKHHKQNIQNAHSAQKVYVDLPEKQSEHINKESYNNQRKTLNNLEQDRKNISETSFSSETVVQPLYSGILPVHLHQLVKSESQSKPWSVPYYDYEIEGTEHRNKYVKKNSSADTKSHKTETKSSDYGCCQKQTSRSNFDFYTVPEPEPVNYAQYEKLHTADDEDFSKNAKIQTKERKVSVIKTNKYENPVKW